MEATLRTRAKRIWNAFLDKSAPGQEISRGQVSYGDRPDRNRMSFGNERSMIASIYTRLSLDVCSIRMQHVRVGDNGQYEEGMVSGLNECLTVSTNIDQTARAFIQDAVLSLFDNGSIAIVPIDTTIDPTNSDAFDINTMRVGYIREWYPSAVKVEVYNERDGKREELTLPKRMVAIVENPLYNIMNEPNSTLKRLVRKLNLLDDVDEKASSGKLDILIQLPYTIKSDARKKAAKERLDSITEQLRGSEYGIAYTDATENVIQLNRPAENNLMKQIEYLTSMLYSQLGLTTSIMDGTADEKTMLNYMKRTIEPIAFALVDSMNRTFISKTARTQGQKIMTFTDAFKLVPMADLADMADKFTRNEVLAGNEVRAIIGFQPSKDPSADELRNKNINKPKEEEGGKNIDENEE